MSECELITLQAQPHLATSPFWRATLKYFCHIVLLAVASAGWGSAAVAAKPVSSRWFAAQEAALRTSLAATAAIVVRTDQALQVKLPVSSVFAADAVELLPDGKALLDLLAAAVRKSVRTQIVVAIYTDAIGSSAYNLQQSQTRAAVVTAYLQAQGIAAPRLIARGAGESAPLNAEKTPEERELNRRVEMTISALSSP